MKIAVLGTSNSIIGNKGYLSYLSLHHDIIQLSCGRNSLLYHIKTIIEKRDLIESSDLLIIDHYVNDINHYRKVFGKDYATHRDNLYKMLSTLNVNIVNILFSDTKHRRAPLLPHL